MTNVTTILIIYGNIWNGLVLGHLRSFWLVVTSTQSHTSFSLFIYAEALSNTCYLILAHTHTMTDASGATWSSASCPKILWNPGSGMAGHLALVVGWGKEAGQRHNEQYKRSWSSKLPPLTDGAPNPCGPSCALTTHSFWALLGPLGTYWSITYESIIRVWVLNDTADTKGQKEFPTCLSDPFFFVKVLFI